MIGWVQWLTYILSFFVPPFGVITFWIFSGRDEEQRRVGKWCLVLAFAGVVVWAICGFLGLTFHRFFWHGMGMWR